jgi:hypothetical protein
MKLEEFVIGEFFWTGGGKWKCFDKGSRTVVALRWETVTRDIIQTVYKDGIRQEIPTQRVINPTDASWYELDAVIFHTYDFDGCWKTEEEYNTIMEIVKYAK